MNNIMVMAFLSYHFLETSKKVPLLRELRLVSLWNADNPSIGWISALTFLGLML
jgi:hypothetical protein